MIAYLEGSVIHRHANYLILKCGAVGYKIYISPTQNINLANTLSLYIYEHIREDRDDLYGFANIGELEIFEILISVSGLGPKMALSILSVMDKDKIESTIEKGDYKVFQEIKGIGKKLAAKIILELKNKIELSDIDKLQGAKKIDLETEEALLSLGFKKHEIQKIIDQMPNELRNITDKVKWALKNAK